MFSHSFRFALNRTDQSPRMSAPALLDASIDLDDPDLAGAEILFTIDGLVEDSRAVSPGGISWEDDEARPDDVDRRFHYSTRLSIAALERQASYVAKTTGAPTGAIVLLEQGAYRSTTRQGRLFVAAIHEEDRNAAGTGAGDLDRPGVFVWWTGEAGSRGAVVSGTITAHLSRVAGGSASTLLQLPDTPSAYGNAGQVLATNSTRTGTIWANAGTGQGSSTFTGLIDTPSAYTGEGGKYLAVNSGATAVEFVDAPSGGAATGGGKGRKIAETTLPTGVQSAGTFLSQTWTIESDFTSDYSSSSGRLFVPRCIDHPGWVVEVLVGTETAACSWIPSNALNTQTYTARDSGGDTYQIIANRYYDGGNYQQIYRMGCTVFGGTAGNRAINLRFQRQQTSSHADAFDVFGGGQDALLANTKIVMYEWIPGKGEKGDKGDPGSGATTSLPWGSITGKPTFAPANAEQNVNADWNATSGDAQILNKPTIPSLASNTETITGTDTAKAVTPAGLEAKLPYRVLRITQTAYDALGTKDADTLYLISG